MRLKGKKVSALFLSWASHCNTKPNSIFDFLAPSVWLFPVESFLIGIYKA